MENSDVVRQAVTLAALFSTRQQTVPGTRMVFGGIANQAMRRDTVHYQASLK